MCKDIWRFPLEWGNGDIYGTLPGGLDIKLGAEENIGIKKLKIYNEKRNS
jgi:hypothetical protein